MTITIVIPRIAQREGFYWQRLERSVRLQMLPGDELISAVDEPPHKDYGAWLRNRALSQAKGDYIYGLDDDDELLPGALEAMRRRALEAPGKILVFNALCEYDGRRVLTGGAPIYGQGYRWFKEVYTQSMCVPVSIARLSHWQGIPYNDQMYFDAIGGHSRAAHFDDIVARICINRQNKPRDW